ncbi:MAG: hypothetical protein RL497_2604 [Pseudomonadota bacterium]|jgi:hypothetical protein
MRIAVTHILWTVKLSAKNAAQLSCGDGSFAQESSCVGRISRRCNPRNAPAAKSKPNKKPHKKIPAFIKIIVNDNTVRAGY